ncbi:glycosyl hydrolase family 17 protein [Thalassomonas sp. M1454]|uniref:glycoside hydrolase family 17 protein n=1 Tax=Thalassomonas sp. M1454 TaxID=2594477 RepID=UPI00117D7A3F|nr:glycosyl hydrolase family 17 protein [Thalassomonas sp. M1454]TRX52838.1 glycosyl hydrolase [Thalassomonas sp. M1454]
MSSNSYKKQFLAGENYNRLSTDELKTVAAEILQNKIHGISFSPYVEGQGPGSQISKQQIEDRLQIIKGNINWVRSFSCTEGNQYIPEIAKKQGLKTMVGVWLDDDLANNELELTNAIEVAKAGHADILAVGNEVLLRGDLTQEQLIDYITRAKQAVPEIEVGYVDAYYEFEDHPKVAEACDLILANCYPFWEGCALEYSLLYMKDMYQRALKAGNGKRVIITETGWPNVGTAEYGAIPSTDNAIKYFVNTYMWAENDDIDVFYFSSFDEAWKVADEGDVGAYWGLWDKDGKLKYA